MAAPQITVTANFIDLAQNATSGYAEFLLQSPSGQQDLRIVGTGIFAAKKILSGFGSSFSVLLYGNDVIVDTGGNSNTYYIVNLYTKDQHIFWTGLYSFTGSGTINLVNASPLNPAPVISVPTVIPLPASQGGTGVGQANANLVFAGPSSGGAQPPSFRGLVAADFSFPLVATSINSTQSGQAGPIQVGPDWYPGTASGVCQIPAAPTVTLESSTGGTVADGTYLVKVSLVNRNGQTTVGSATTFSTGAHASTNKLLVQLSDLTYRSGCYAYNVYISSDSGATYWLQSKQTISASFSSLTRAANGVVSAVTTAGHGMIPGESITVSGVTGGATSFNGSFTLVGQQVNTPSTLFWFQAGTVESATPSTGTVVASPPVGGAFSHFAPGDFIVSAVVTSGTNPPGGNTATIDALQVALNATCNYAIAACANGQLIVPQGSTVLTTPLIVSGQQTVAGVNSAVSGGKSEISCSWKDPNLGCVIVLGTANGVDIHGIDIEAQGHALMLAGWGPGFGNFGQHVYNNSIVTSDATGQYSAIYFHAGTFYNEHFENNFLQGGLADVQLDAVSGGWVFFSGSRWNAANLSGIGRSSNDLLSVSSVTDPDRGVLRGSFPNGMGMFQISNLFTETGTGVNFDAVNLGLKLSNVNSSDSAAIAGTPAVVRVGNDANSTGVGSFAPGVILEDTYLVPGSGVPTQVQVIGATTGFTLTERNYTSGATNALDLNNAAIDVQVTGSNVWPYEGAASNKIINIASAASVQVNGTPYDGTSATGNAMHWLKGGVRWGRETGSTNGFYSTWPANGNWSWWTGDPATAANLWAIWSFGATGARVRFFQNDGATPLFDVNAISSANSVNILNPANVSSNMFSVGSHIRFDSTSSGNYFITAGSPTSVRSITFPDNSGTVAELNLAQSFTATQTLNNPPVAAGSAAGLTGTGACGTITTQSGGSWAGTAKCTGSTGASTLTITPGTTAPHGWVCYVQDQTTPANLFQQTSNNATTCVLTAASITSNDVFVFSAIAF